MPYFPSFPFISLHMGLCRVPGNLDSLYFPSCGAAFAGILGVLSPFISICLPSWGGSLPDSWIFLFYLFFFLHMRGLCRDLGRSIFLYLVLSPFIWVGFVGCLSVLFPFISFHAEGFCRDLEYLVVLCLPSSPFIWVVFIGILNILFPFVSLYMGGFGRVLGYYIYFRFSLSPFIRAAFVGFLVVLSLFVSLRNGGLVGFLGVSSPFISLYLPSYG